MSRRRPYEDDGDEGKFAITPMFLFRNKIAKC